MFKATSLFGGVQVFNILITIIRGKLVSVLIGTAGMGANGIFMSTVTLMKNLTSLGLPESAVREIAVASSTENADKVARVTTVFERWIWFTALLGTLIMLVLAPYLSQWAFGDREHSLSFMALAIVLLLGALTGGTYTLLRGMRRNKYLAMANILGSAFSLLASLPILYFFGQHGVVGAIVASSAVSFLLSFYFKRKLEKIKPVPLSLKQTFSEGVGMAKLGIVLSLTSFFTAGVTFVVTTFIARTGSLDEVGLYNAGMSITAGYVGIVFTAMITDYLPRVTAVIHQDLQWKEIVRQQAELVILILGPILVLLITTAPIVIRVLLTPEFLPIVEYIGWAILGIFVQGIVWSLGVVIIAKGDFRLKLYTEIVSHLFLLAANMVGFYFWGLRGLGIALLVGNLFDLLLVGLVARLKYKFSFTGDFSKLSSIVAIACTLASAGSLYFGYPTAYLTGGICFCFVSAFSYYQLNKRLDFSGAIRQLRNKFLK
jgi:O-antigen/teichoic acid export membrane protein